MASQSQSGDWPASFESKKASEWPGPGDDLWHRTVHFVHIPKCAGSAICAGLAVAFPKAWSTQPNFHGTLDSVASSRAVWKIYRQMDWRAYHRRYMEFCHNFLMQEILRGTCLIGGHFPYSPLARRKFGEKYFAVTVLREPLARLQSNVIWLTIRAGKHPLSDYAEGRRDPCAAIEEFIEEDPLFPWIARTASLQIGGMGPVEKGKLLPKPQLGKAASNALVNIEKFDLVGFQDDLDTFRERLGEKLGLRVNFGRGNTTDSFLGDEQTRRRIYGMFTGARRQKLEEACRDDIRLYEHARTIRTS